MTKSQVPEWVNPIFHAIQFGQFGYLQELLNDRLVAGARDHKRELSQIASSVDSFGANPLIDDLAKTLGWRVNRRTSTNGVLGLLVADFQIYYNRSPERTGLVFQVQTSPDKNYRIGDPSFQKAIAQGIQGAERFLNRYYFPQKERPLAISLRLPHCPEQPLSDEAAQKIFGESIALATALALIMNNKSTLVAATGALDEEGRVKKVGGVVEKLFGLVREVPDCKLVFVPAENKIEIESNHELTQKLRENHITVEYISHLDELFEHPAITIPGADQKPYSRALSIRARSCLQDNKIKALELRLGSHPDANEPYPAGKICLAADFRISEKNWQQLYNGDFSPGWSCIDLDADKNWDFFSKTIFSDFLKEKTSQTLLWLKNSNGETRPLCLKLEISNRVPKKFIPADLQKEGDTGFLELLRIDLIPFSDGECFRAWLRFVFSVAPTTIGSYLTWACQRKFEKSWQVDHRSGQKIKLEKLANSIISAFINHQDPWQEETPKAEALIHSWQMIQALLVSYAPKKLFLEDPAWETGIYLLAGLHNPRTISDDKLASFKPVFWQHADSQNTVFAFDKHGLSVFADAQDGFNRSYKPSIITAAYGLFWLLSIYWQGSSLGRASLEAFTEAQEERVRAAFLKALCAWRLKTG